MPFNSVEYFLFFSVVFLANWALFKNNTLRIFFLLLASFFFYASNNGWILLLLIGSTALDFYAARYIEDTPSAKASRKGALTISLVANLGTLAIFKYFNFFIDSALILAQGLGFSASPMAFEIFLPVGISFYTFQSMSYTIDVYQGKLKAERSFLNFAFFVAFFPQLVAGPIVRARYFLHQIPFQPKLSLQGMEAAFYLIASGLIKKLVLGDTLGDYADQAFGQADSAHAVILWLGLLAFTFQIYFDFSGYTDIAIGCARLLGFRLPPNFRRPYVAVSFSEFWRRWHISLSYWLRDYLYKNLGGNRGSLSQTYRNLMIVMILGGLWHGAAWTFVIWGALHGLFLALERFFNQAKTKKDLVGKPFSRFTRSFVIFFFCALAWLPFRATNFGELMDFVQGFIRVDVPLVLTLGHAVAFLIILGGYSAQWLGEVVSFKRLYKRSPFLIRAGFLTGATILTIIFSARGTQPFIYFQF